MDVRVFSLEVLNGGQMAAVAVFVVPRAKRDGDGRILGDDLARKEEANCQRGDQAGDDQPDQIIAGKTVDIHKWFILSKLSTCCLSALFRGRCWGTSLGLPVAVS